jgi:hypothetical protein
VRLQRLQNRDRLFIGGTQPFDHLIHEAKVERRSRSDVAVI